MSKQVLIRAHPDEHQRWKTAATTQGITLSEYLRTAANNAAQPTTGCTHPPEHRHWNIRTETCRACGTKLR